MRVLRKTRLQRASAWMTLLLFSLSLCVPPLALSQNLSDLPVPGTFISPTSNFNAPVLSGVRVDAQHPLRLEFLIQNGQAPMTAEEIERESQQLIKYFLASLTIPDKDLWVNLHPEQSGQTISEPLQQTDMGHVLLKQDYLLKQLTASMLHPDQEPGRRFWKNILDQSSTQLESAITGQLLHRIWIVPKDAVVVEDAQGAYVVSHRLQVRLERDDLTIEEDGEDITEMAQELERVILPAIEEEINHGRNFAPLRQVYQSMILAAWYKRRLRQSLLGQTYADRAKVRGIDTPDNSIGEQVYQQYLRSLRRGVYNFIREEPAQGQGHPVPRQYFSGGILSISPSDLTIIRADQAQLSEAERQQLSAFLERSVNGYRVTADLFDLGSEADAAILSDDSDDSHRLSQSQTENIVNARPSGILRPIDLFSELRRFGAELQAERIDQYDLVRRQSMTVYDFVDRIPDEGFTQGHILGMHKWQDNYQTLADLSGLKTWNISYQEMFGREREHRQEFMERILQQASKDRPIYFLVPRGVFSHPHRNDLARELRWLLTSAESLDHVYFVFGAYDTVSASDWNHSSLSAGQGLSASQRRQVFAYLLKNHPDYMKAPMFPADPDSREAVHNAAVVEIERSFEEYFMQFQRVTAKARENFMTRNWANGLSYSQMRFRLYNTIASHTAQAMGQLLGRFIDDPEMWSQVRQTIEEDYRTEDDVYKLNLLLNFHDTIRSQLSTLPMHAADVDFDLNRGASVIDMESTSAYPFVEGQTLEQAVQAIITPFGLNQYFEDFDVDVEVATELLSEQLEAINPALTIESFEMVNSLFYRNKGAYIVGRMQTSEGIVPLVFALNHRPAGISIDAVVSERTAVRNLLLSSTRVAFHVLAADYREIIQFIAEMYPEVNRAQIYDLLGLGQRSQYVYLGELYGLLEEGQKLEFIGQGPQSVTFSAPEAGLVLKVVRDDAPDRNEVITNYQDIHKSNRLGQLLDSWRYSNLRLPRDMVSDELLEILQRETQLDVMISNDDVVFLNVYAQRRIMTVPQYLEQTQDDNIRRETLLKLGWNIKHLAAMGILPTDVSMRHFGITSWGRVVYLNNAGLARMAQSEFYFSPQYQYLPEHNMMQDPIRRIWNLERKGIQYDVYPSAMRPQMNIPAEFETEFMQVHADLFTPDFWNSMKWRLDTDQLPDIFPYASRFRLKAKRMARTLRGLGLGNATDEITDYSEDESLEISEIKIKGLKFLELKVPNPRARILVVEPIGPDIISMLHQKLGNVNFDIIQPESEVVEDAKNWTPGVRGKLVELVNARHYDYVLGYVNETFDVNFFNEAEIKGLILFSTGIHNIDLEAATANGIVVTNAPGPTTVAVAEQNIGLMLDSVYGNRAHDQPLPDHVALVEQASLKSASPDTVAQILWYQLLRQSLKLDEMFTFGGEGRYVRTGVGSLATVYHEQLGQSREAGIHQSIGIVGLDAVGERLVEMAILHELSTIYVLREEFDAMPEDTLIRWQALIDHIKRDKAEFGVDIVIKAVSREDMIARSNYLLATPEAVMREDVSATDLIEKLDVNPADIFVRESDDLSQSMAGLSVGIQGLGRIGKAVAQRLTAMGADILVNQRLHTRLSYQRKRAFLDALIRTLNATREPLMELISFVEQQDLVESSNILTTLTPLTTDTRVWIDAERLKDFGREAKGSVRAIVSQVKNLIDEEALLDYLKDRSDVEVRLDVVNQEERGDAHLRFRDDKGQPLTNIKIAGHTAAAVAEVRRLKVRRAMDNLEHMMDDKLPPNVLNPLVLRPDEQDIELAGLKFRRMRVVRPKANVLVVEPLNEDILEAVYQQFPDVNFDVIQSESEIIERDGRLISGIDPSIDQIVRENDYDFCVGYCNTRFDEDFFEGADLKGLVLFATAEHHIDLDAATNHQTLVTTAPGPTTTAVAEQNVGLALDGLFGQDIVDQSTPDAIRLSDIHVRDQQQRSSVAQIMWYSLLKKVLKLDEMFEFGRSGNYAKTGVAVDATVYHDQLGQNLEAGIQTRVGVLGLNGVGVELIEYAIAHEVSKIHVYKEEFDGLDVESQMRIITLFETVESMAADRDVEIDLVFVEDLDMMYQVDYLLKTSAAPERVMVEDESMKYGEVIRAADIFIRDENVLTQSLVGRNVGVHGIRRIGTAVAQRLLVMGINLLVDEASLDTRDINLKRSGFFRLFRHRRGIYKDLMNEPTYLSKSDFLRRSEMITLLGNSSAEENFHWIDRDALEMFGADAPGDTRVLINVSKYQADEDAIKTYARLNPQVQIRLDVLSDETTGEDQNMFVDVDGEALANVKLSGHTAAAVWAVRRLKINRALNNLRSLIDGQIPSHILNPEVLGSQSADEGGEDEAMTAESADDRKVGGINLDTSLLDLQIQRDDNGIPLPLHQQHIEHMQIQGFIPIIIHIEPIMHVPFILGSHQSPDVQPSEAEWALSKSRP